MITNPGLIPFLPQSVRESVSGTWQRIFGDVSKIADTFVLNWATVFQVIAIILMMGFISVLGVPYSVYSAGTKLLSNLLTPATICLAVSPALKAIGVPSRPRLFEAKRAIRDYEERHHTRVLYYIATPRMALYEQVSAQIYSIVLRYAAPEDVHVYSVDESFVYATPYLHLYEEEARRTGQHPAHVMAMTMIRDILKETGI